MYRGYNESIFNFNMNLKFTIKKMSVFIGWLCFLDFLNAFSLLNMVLAIISAPVLTIKLWTKQVKNTYLPFLLVPLKSLLRFFYLYILSRRYGCLLESSLLSAGEPLLGSELPVMRYPTVRPLDTAANQLPFATVHDLH